MIIYDIEVWKGFTSGGICVQAYDNVKSSSAVYRANGCELVIGLSERYEDRVFTNSTLNYPVDLVSVIMSFDCFRGEEYIFRFSFDFTNLIGPVKYPSGKYVKSDQKSITLFGVELPYPTVEYLSKNTSTSIMTIENDEEMLDFLMNLKLLAK